MLIPHKMDHENHIYKVENEFVLSTGDVIELNGLSDLSMIPIAQVRHAGHRGSALHLAIQAYETDCDVADALHGYEALEEVDVFDEVQERLKFYLRWRGEHEVKLAGKMEESRVYRHEGTGQLIGGTPDFPCYVDGEFTILDVKSSHKNYGEKSKQDRLKWCAQLQSYKEAMQAEHEQMDPASIHRMILHLHPTCGKNGVKGAQTGFEAIPFNGEDEFLWDSLIRVATAKLSNGYKLQRR
jgi:hypothetical protein